MRSIPSLSYVEIVVRHVRKVLHEPVEARLHVQQTGWRERLVVRQNVIHVAPDCSVHVTNRPTLANFQVKALVQQTVSQLSGKHFAEHVGACPACSSLLAELESDRSLLQSMPVPPMRLRYIGRHTYRWVLAAAVAASLALCIWLWPNPAPVETLQIAVRAPSAPEVRLVSRPPVAELQQPRRQVNRDKPAMSLAAALEAALPPLAYPPVTAKDDVVIAMQTEDPNVMIVLLQGDSDE
jgi:hypothetical protein